MNYELIDTLKQFSFSFNESDFEHSLCEAKDRLGSSGITICSSATTLLCLSRSISGHIPDHEFLSVSSAVRRYENAYRQNVRKIFGVPFQKMFPIGIGDGEISVVQLIDHKHSSNLIVWEMGGDRAYRFESTITYLKMLAEAFNAGAYTLNPTTKVPAFSGIDYFECFNRYCIESSEPFDF
jgi:hypothetical protein